MAFFALIMLEISLILAEKNPVYEDTACKFFEHFVAIVDAMNRKGEGEGMKPILILLRMISACIKKGQYFELICSFLYYVTLYSGRVLIKHISCAFFCVLFFFEITMYI